MAKYAPATITMTMTMTATIIIGRLIARLLEKDEGFCIRLIWHLEDF